MGYRQLYGRPPARATHPVVRAGPGRLAIRAGELHGAPEAEHERVGRRAGAGLALEVRRRRRDQVPALAGHLVEVRGQAARGGAGLRAQVLPARRRVARATRRHRQLGRRAADRAAEDEQEPERYSMLHAAHDTRTATATGGQRRASASTPAWAHTPSCCEVTPLTPIAPTILPSTSSGMPPSSGRTPGMPRIAIRPPSTASSNALLGRLNRTAVRALSCATCELATWVSSARSKYSRSPAVSTMATATVQPFLRASAAAAAAALRAVSRLIDAP